MKKIPICAKTTEIKFRTPAISLRMLQTAQCRRQLKRTAIQWTVSINRQSTFLPRSSFHRLVKNSFTWFPGHMLAGLRAVAAVPRYIDLMIETRDARIPLSSRIPYLEDLR